MAVASRVTTARLVPTSIGIMNAGSVVGGSSFPWLAALQSLSNFHAAPVRGAPYLRIRLNRVGDSVGEVWLLSSGQIPWSFRDR